MSRRDGVRGGDVGDVDGLGFFGGPGIVGVGVDAVSVARFRRLLERRPRFAARCFTEVEQTDAGSSTDRAQSLAARFAAKEAVMKALGTGLGGFALTDVEVRRTGGTDATRHAPYLVLHGAAASLAEAQGAGRFHVSLTHTEDVAIAFVVAEQGGAGAPPEGPGADRAAAVVVAAAAVAAAVAGSAGSRSCAPS
ncbi:MAG TPA: holo-ACP synthase [Acidimicrobiales bacterium]